MALKLNRKFIGIELNKNYIEIANKRLKPYLEQKKLVEISLSQNERGGKNGICKNTKRSKRESKNEKGD